MRPEHPLHPHEVRIIKINGNILFELIGEILNDICHERFHLPLNPNDSKLIRIDRIANVEQGEIVLFAYNSIYELDKEAIMVHFNNLKIEATESLLLKPNGRNYYHSIHGTPFIINQANVTNVNIEYRAQFQTWNRLRTMLYSNGRKLRKHEVRVIRLSRQAIYELVWEHFMKAGNEILDVPENDFSVIFGMYMDEKMEMLALYAMDLSNASDAVFSKVNTYCDQSLSFTTDSLSKKTMDEQKYISIVLPIS